MKVPKKLIGLTALGGAAVAIVARMRGGKSAVPPGPTPDPKTPQRNNIKATDKEHEETTTD